MLKANLVPSIVSSSNGGRSDVQGTTPQLTLLRGKPGSIPVRLENLYDHRLAGTLLLDVPPTWTQQPRIAFQLEPRQHKILTIPVAVPEATPIQSLTRSINVTFERTAKLPDVTKTFVVSVISPQNVGNLLKNGDFEDIGSDGKSAKHWQGTGAELVSSEGPDSASASMCLSFRPPSNGRTSANPSNCREEQPTYTRHGSGTAARKADRTSCKPRKMVAAARSTTTK